MTELNSDFGSFAAQVGFNLARYKRFERNPSWWAAQLSARLACREAIEEKNPYARWMLQLLVHDPLRAFAGMGAMTDPVRKARRSDVLEAAALIPGTPADQPAPPLSSSRFLSFDYDHGSPWSRSKILVVVDVGAADDVIEDKLRQVIDEGRRQRRIEKRRKKTHKAVTEAEMARWETSKLLPYLDLLLLADFYGQHVSERQLTTLLFPEAEGDRDALNTAQAQHSKVFNGRFIDLLASQGAWLKGRGQ